MHLVLLRELPDFPRQLLVALRRRERQRTRQRPRGIAQRKAYPRTAVVDGEDAHTGTVAAVYDCRTFIRKPWKAARTTGRSSLQKISQRFLLPRSWDDSGNK